MPWQRALPGLAAALAICILALPAAAGPLSADLARAGWKAVSFPGIPATLFRGLDDGAIEVSATDSSALLYRAVAPLREGVLRWRWRVEKAPPPSDLALKDGDDRPLALHLWFPLDEDAGLWERLAGSAFSAFLGAPPPGKVVTYVWGGFGPRGRLFTNPHVGADGVMIVLRPGDTPTGRWFSEEVDFAADFERAFGYPPAAPTHIAISGDSDDCDGMSLALIADIGFADD